MSRELPLETCQPSQLLLDVEKLRGVLERTDPEDLAYEPIPVVPAHRLPLRSDATRATETDLEDRVVLTDGHTRAFVAACCGVATLRAVEDPDVEDLPLEVYARCVEWCLEAGVTGPADFVGRVVSRERYLEEWVARCHALEAYSDGE